MAVFLPLSTPMTQAANAYLPDGVGFLGGAMVLRNYPRSDQFQVREVVTEDAQYKILVIIPVITKEFNAGLIKEISAVQASDFHIDYQNLTSGTNSGVRPDVDIVAILASPQITDIGGIMEAWEAVRAAIPNGKCNFAYSTPWITGASISSR